MDRNSKNISGGSVAVRGMVTSAGPRPTAPTRSTPSPSAELKSISRSFVCKRTAWPRAMLPCSTPLAWQCSIATASSWANSLTWPDMTRNG